LAWLQNSEREERRGDRVKEVYSVLAYPPDVVAGEERGDGWTRGETCPSESIKGLIFMVRI
jgi:hypothetical protein